MKEVECITNFGCWCRPGKILTINNNLAKWAERKRYVNIIKDVPKESQSKYILKEKVKEVIDKVCNKTKTNLIGKILKKELGLC